MGNWVMQRGRAMLVAAALCGLAGCKLFVSHFDATAYQYFTSLKAYHLKFLDDFRAGKDASGQDKSYSAAEAATACSAGDLKFREASEYAAGKQDDSRVRAVKYLHEAFAESCRLMLQKQKRLFSSAYVQEELGNVTPNYDFAIAGESSRVGAPKK